MRRDWNIKCLDLPAEYFLFQVLNLVWACPLLQSNVDISQSTALNKTSLTAGFMACTDNPAIITFSEL